MANLKILAVSGSLRAKSSNSMLVNAAAALAPVGMQVTIFRGLADLPHFNPDLDIDVPPKEILALRTLVGSVDGLLISSPEYAHGVPGSLKNALDWLVASVEFPEKPVMLIGGGEYAQAQLLETLRTMSARVHVNELIKAPALRAAFDAQGRLQSPEIDRILRDGLAGFHRFISQ